jgi:hypothetical protein
LRERIDRLEKARERDLKRGPTTQQSK